MMQVSSPGWTDKEGLVNISQVRCFLQDCKTEKYHWIEELSDEELAQELIQISNIKRLLERWQADPDFRQQFLTDPYQTVAHYNLNIDPDVIRQLWYDALHQTDAEDHTPLLVKRYQDFYRGLQYDMLQIAGSSSNPRFKAWRERQIARTSSQMCKSFHDDLLHMTACFELSKGCSVGCYFCSVSAPRLGDIFTYNQENAKLWREVLESLRDIHGLAAKASFCYWATDPLDNPDYEKFCSDFYKILRIFPQTTTAQPLKDPARTRSLLNLSQQSGRLMNRFSILSLKMLDKLHKEFTPEELVFVRLVLQNSEAGIIKANAGRAREYNKRKAEKNHEVLDDSLPGTNACVTGFLFNMVERSVKLISPCNADDRWPLGYRVYEEGNFADIDDLKALIEGMIDRYMPLTVRPNDRISFRRDLKYESLPDGFQVSTRFKTHKFRSDLYLKQLGEVIYRRDKTAEEIASLFNIYGTQSAHIFQALNLMFQHGILEN